MQRLERMTQGTKLGSFLKDSQKSGGASFWSRWAGLVVPPVLLLALVLGFWQAVTALLAIPDYILPSPAGIIGSALENRAALLGAAWTTLTPIAIGYASAIVVGISLALVMSISKVLERSIYPYAVVLQTIPVVAIAPLIVIWFGAGVTAVSIIAFIIALFPMISNTILGLTSTDHNLVNLMRLYNASALQTMWKLRLPSALPYIMGGMRISAGLSVIGAIVGEFVAGIGGGDGGLGYVITSAAINLQTDYLFAAALASGVLGVIIFGLVTALSNAVLGSWHESSAKQEN